MLLKYAQSLFSAWSRRISGNYCIDAPSNWLRDAPVWETRAPAFAFIFCRSLTYHPHRRVAGHKLEYIMGKHTKQKIRPPLIPLHPVLDTDRNMELFTTFKDLKLRWKTTSRHSRKRMNIARKWPVIRTTQPLPRPSTVFISHKNRTFVDIPLHPTPNQPSKPLSQHFPGFHLDTSDCFCIFKSSIANQHKVTMGDLVQTERLHRREAGEEILFGTVLMIGSKDWTIIGKPTVPYARVRATIEQQTLTGEQISFKYRKHRRTSRFQRVRHWVTMLRIEEIILDDDIKISSAPIQPKRLLDLWANRWLQPKELKGIRYQKDGVTPLVEDIYSGKEHQPGSYHRRGLEECYRWYPDPFAPDSYI